MWGVRAAMVMAAMALLTVTAACAKDESPNVATAQSPGVLPTSTLSLADLRESALKYVKCMREEGVPLDDPDPAGKIQLKPGDKTNPSFSKAFEKCKSHLPAGGPGVTAPFSAEQLEKMRQYAKCMRENGVPDFADPGPQGFTTAPKNQAAADQANVKCAPILGVNPSATAGQG